MGSVCSKAATQDDKKPVARSDVTSALEAAPARAASAGIDRARAKHDRLQDMLDRFGTALAALDTVLSAGAKLPIFGRIRRRCRHLITER